MKEQITIEAPRSFNADTVIHWEPISRQLKIQKAEGDNAAGSLLTKAKMFLKNNCIEQEGDHWICKPVEGYNKQTSRIFDNGKNELECDCQGYAVAKGRGKAFCSHCLAVHQFIFMHSGGPGA